MKTKVDQRFIDDVFELAFGEDAISREYHPSEVLSRLWRYCEDSHRWEQHCEKNSVDFEDIKAADALLHNSGVGG